MAKTSSGLQFIEDSITIRFTSSFARFARSATSPSFSYVSNPAPESSPCRAACCSPIVSASAAAPRLHPLQLLLPDSIHFSCCSTISSICFNCCSPFLSASAAAPDCTRFSSPNASVPTAPHLCLLRLLPPIASTSTAALPDCIRKLFWKILVRGSVN